VRTLLNYTKRALAEALRFAAFLPQDPVLWAQVESIEDEFLRGMWRAGMLFPSDDASRAFFYKCDEENNPDSERSIGRMNTEVGINPPLPSEFIILGVSTFNDRVEIEERG
jgi:uncharacterized protein